jgi:hypothetical protein
MKKWLRRIRSVVLMGLTWAVVWAPVSVLIGTIVDPDESMDEPWVAMGVLPGFVCGALFSAVLGIAEGRREFDELSLFRAVAWGTMSGLLVGLLPFALGTPNYDHPLMLLGGAVIVGCIALLSAASGSGSLMLARRARPWRTLLAQLLASDQRDA